MVTTEYTELQPLLSGVHSVMRVKSVLAGGEGGGARPPPLITFTLTSKVAVYAPAEWADTLTLFHLYQYMYSVMVTLSTPLLLCPSKIFRQGNKKVFPCYGIFSAIYKYCN
jgi:hypothetical protein